MSVAWSAVEPCAEVCPEPVWFGAFCTSGRIFPYFPEEAAKRSSGHTVGRVGPERSCASENGGKK